MGNRTARLRPITALLSAALALGAAGGTAAPEEAQDFYDVIEWAGTNNMLVIAPIGNDSLSQAIYYATGGPALSAEVFKHDAPQGEVWDQWQARGSPVLVLQKQTACAPCHRQRCPRADHPCMNGLDPRLVVRAANWLPDRGATPARSASKATPFNITHLFFFIPHPSRCSESLYRKHLILRHRLPWRQ